jgi:hypothetical protein
MQAIAEEPEGAGMVPIWTIRKTTTAHEMLSINP